jgi:hypothetical protein
MSAKIVSYLALGFPIDSHDLVCQIDRLRRALLANIRRVLNDFPKTLDETYGRTLLGIDEEK